MNKHCMISLKHYFDKNVLSSVFVPYSKVDFLNLLNFYYYSDYELTEVQSMADCWFQAADWANNDVWSNEDTVNYSEEEVQFLVQHRWEQALEWFEDKIKNGVNKSFYEDMMDEQEYFFD